MKYPFGLRAALIIPVVLVLAVGSAGLTSCQSEAGVRRDSTRADSGTAVAPGVQTDSAASAWVPRPILVEPDPAAVRAKLAADSARADSARADSAAMADSARADSAGLADSAPGGQRPGARSKTARRGTAPKVAPRERRGYQLTPADSARWPVKGPAPLPGALLPDHRIVAFYGNPISTRMGILGQLPPNEMLPKLERTATEWAKAEPGRKVMPALHVIVTVAQGKPGPGGKYRLRHSDKTIERVLGWAEERGWIVFLDVQTGHSSVADELPHLVKFLERPYVHLALDPEFAMKNGGVPGQRIGTLDATDVNHAAAVLADIVERKRVPPKLLVVHRFTQRMLTNHSRIKLDPRVQIVIDMDGFGAPWLKEDAYKFFIVPEPVQYAGFKLFYKNDKPMMTPEQVIRLWPSPLYIQYQ
ncbi:MAG TPA: hypothetical protein VMY76_06680 [Gemmatimonadales bacterium]|nr:hypothetical protein [Gemmatimonadales bacterium]